MSKKSKLPLSVLEHTPWEKNSVPIWPTSIFILKRNLARHLFPGKMNEKNMQTSYEIIQEALSQLMKNAAFIRAEELSPTEKEYLFEYFLLADSMQNNQSGQGFVIDEDASCLVQINMGDHLTLCCFDCNVDWKNSWNRISELEIALGKALEFAYHPKFGYLTSDPKRCGTTLHIQTFLHLPALIHFEKLHATLESCKESDIDVQSISGNLEEPVGDMIILQNRYSLGISEESILHHLHTSAIKLMKEEQACRDEIKEKGTSVIKDKVSRAFGILSHSYQLQTHEALSALSLLKLGIDLGWTQGINHAQINELMFKCRRAHLTIKEENLPKEEIAQKRSQLLHTSLKAAQLKI